MRAEIADRFQDNLDRVRGLVQAYVNASDGAGRRPVGTTDVLRAAVVFLHAALEDLVRSALEWKLPSASAEHLKEIPLAGVGRREKFALSDLASHRGKTVDQVIEESVSASLGDSNFNNPGELDRTLEKLGIPGSLLTPSFRRQLGPLMQRRHWIVHRADRNHTEGRGHHAARPLPKGTVEGWIGAVEEFGKALLKALGEETIDGNKG